MFSTAASKIRDEKVDMQNQIESEQERAMQREKWSNEN